MNYILDTDICIYWFKGFMNIKNMVHKISPERIKISVFTLAELKYGAYHSQNIDKNIVTIHHVELMTGLPCFGFVACLTELGIVRRTIPNAGSTCSRSLTAMVRRYEAREGVATKPKQGNPVMHRWSFDVLLSSYKIS